MTKEERTLLIQFISRSAQNNELINLETQILGFFVDFANSEKDDVPVNMKCKKMIKENVNF